MSRHETDSLLDKPPKAPDQARRGLALKIVVALCGAAALAAVALPRANSGGLRASPAALKASALKSGLVQEVDKSRWMPECLKWWQSDEAFPTSENPDAEIKSDVEVSDYDLISMPSGLCTNTLFCAFENCAPEWPNTLWSSNSSAAAALGDFVQNGDMEQLAKGFDTKFNLPDQIAFPTSVKDVVDVVNYAKKASMPISVKTSGHNYAGSSTLDGSVNINLRDFPKYSQVLPLMKTALLGEVPAVCPCDADFLANYGLEPPAACKLALARGKPAIIRIGGGELWDEAYRAVNDANFWLQKKGVGLVEIFGGGVGTVSAAGGWMAGGGLGDGSERVHGVGADNVLELEMVLPSGQHVKFAPSKWEDAPGFLYPKTAEVTGLCNANVVADESAWQWEECEVEVPWEDLWYAVRGGGGGSYGVVVALTYQLHKKRNPIPHLLGKWSYMAACPETKYFSRDAPSAVVLPAGCEEIQNAFTDFWIDFLWDPAAIGLPEEASLNCGSTSFKFAIADFKDHGNLVCYDVGFVDGTYPTDLWTSYWKNYTGPTPEGLDMDQWQKALTRMDQYQVSYEGFFFSNLQTYSLMSGGPVYDYYFDPQSRLKSEKALTYGNLAWTWSGLIPPAWFLQKNDDVHNLVMQNFAEFHIMGGNVGKLHDQMTSLSDIYRIAGAQSVGHPGWYQSVLAFYPEAPEGKILGGTEYNHFFSDAYGPLKSDHSVLCPEGTHAEREEQCVSLQEHVWGTDGLARLEAIKAKVDPHSLFQCQKCVGFKGPVRDQ